MNGSILDDSKFTLTSAANNTLTLTIDNVGDYIVNGDTVKVIYNAPETTHKLVDSDGNVTLDFNQTVDIANSSFTQTLASISTAETTTANSGGSTIDLTFSENLTSAGTAVSSVTDYSNLEAAFSIDVNGSILDDSKFTLTSAANNTLTLTIDNVGDYIVNGDTVKVIYNAPETTHKLVDSDGNVTLDFNQAIDITNTSFTQTLASISTAETTTASKRRFND